MDNGNCYCGQPVVKGDVVCEKHKAMRTLWSEAMKRLAEDFVKRNHPTGL